MIFLTVGSWHKGFDRLVQAVDELKQRGVIACEVQAQIGQGKYKPANLNTVYYYSPEEYDKIINQAEILISHVGMGTIIQAIRQGKPVVVMPRKAELGEVNNNHQYDTAEILEKEGKVLVAYETNDLEAKLKEAENFIPNQGEGSQKILSEVEKFIESVVKKKKFRLFNE